MVNYAAIVGDGALALETDPSGGQSVPGQRLQMLVDGQEEETIRGLMGLR